MGNNTASFTIGFADIAVQNSRMERNADGTATFHTDVMNIGFDTAENVTVTIYRGVIADNDVLETRSLGSIAPGSTQQISFTIPSADLIARDEFYNVSFTVFAETSSNENMYSNNSEMAFVRPISVEGISINAEEFINMDVGETLALNTSLMPVGATSTVAWSSSNVNVADVDENGVIRALQSGFAEIVAMAGVDSYDTVFVSVVGDPTAVETVSIAGGDITITVGESRLLTAEILPPTALNRNVNWISSEPNYAEVGSTGENTAEVVGIAIGTTQITAITLDGGYTDTINVTVTSTDIPTVTAVSVTPSTAAVQRGQQQQFTASVSGTNNPAQTVTWVIEGSTNVGTTISNAGLLHVAAGEAATTLTVRATSTLNTAVSGTASVTVTAPPTPPTDPPSDGGGGGGGGWSPPSTPTLSLPANVQINDAVISWNAVNNATGYRIYIGGSPQSEIITTTSFDLATLELPVGTHAIRVRAIYDGTRFDNSSLSRVVNFTVQETPDPTPEPEPTPDLAPEPAPPTPDPVPAPFVNPFTDVNEWDWFFDHVAFVYTRRLMSGMDTTPPTFKPNTHMTRAMTVQVLYNKQGRPSVAGLGNPFTDVAEGAWYRDAVVWAANNGVVSGFGDGKFAPGDNITRAHLLIILNNYSDFAGLTLPLVREYQAFVDDMDIRDYAGESIERFFRAMIVSGRLDGRFDPQGNATRAELATMMHNFLESVE